jgi:hypothetical protein
LGVLVAAAGLGNTILKNQRDVRSHQRDARINAKSNYLGIAGRLAATLDQLNLEADDADKVIDRAKVEFSNLQASGQGEVWTAFGEKSAVVWLESANRSLFKKAVEFASSARECHQTGTAAAATKRQIWMFTHQVYDQETREYLRTEFEAAVQQAPKIVTDYVTENEALAAIARWADKPVPRGRRRRWAWLHH